MGIAKGRAFSAKRSVGHFRVGRMPSAISKKCEITMESMYLSSLHKKHAFDCSSVSSENILSRKLLSFMLLRKSNFDSIQQVS